MTNGMGEKFTADPCHLHDLKSVDDDGRERQKNSRYDPGASYQPKSLTMTNGMGEAPRYDPLPAQPKSLMIQWGGRKNSRFDPRQVTQLKITDDDARREEKSRYAPRCHE
ncbi:hypothetical protein AVEN_258661-1 [Araneus ventricosus]|uniref:Uncharacterized protein n=1 Tax=Araneus ventricosus TaxID=182803 RepID=A0A4Y2W0F0_ARAVE|nr:hypothetical protein AVEN_258661-1 [Araneus ventricosus]